MAGRVTDRHGWLWCDWGREGRPLDFGKVKRQPARAEERIDRVHPYLRHVIVRTCPSWSSHHHRYTKSSTNPSLPGPPLTSRQLDRRVTPLAYDNQMCTFCLHHAVDRRPRGCKHGNRFVGEDATGLQKFLRPPPPEIGDAGCQDGPCFVPLQ